ncbi:MAG: helix-turn-helix domain-containing protein [Clostridiales bacterium]|nr:helix-turn-helix domain-containing protein [Clostridiales bacterium]
MENKYVKNTLKCNIKVSGIYTIHYFKYGKNFNFKGEQHDFWEMIFIDSGKAVIVADNKEYTLSQGQTFFHKPNEVHKVYTGNQFANSAIISFECKSSQVKALADKVWELSEYEKSLLNKIIQEAKNSYDDKLNEIYLTKMNKKHNAPFGGDQIIKNSIELLIISLLRKITPVKTEKQNSEINLCATQLVSDVKDILTKTLDVNEDISLDTLSYKLGFSKSYIKAQFKKQTGYSVIQYYINLKIDKAKELLSQQKYTVSEIADLLGFSSVYYFSRQFKTLTDMSPTEYVNSIKADNVL